MKIVNIIGGLGNQMFQYAFAYAIQRKYPDECVLVDVHYFPSYKIFSFEIEDVFPDFCFPKASTKQVKKVAYFTSNYKVWRFIRRFLPPKKTEYVEKQQDIYNPEVFDIKGDAYYEGYWHAFKYFKDVRPELQNLFSFKTLNDYNLKALSDIKSGVSVGIHIRRGDYLKYPKFMGICDLDYYKNAIEKINLSETKNFFVFSNDIAWCRDNIAPLVGDNKVIFVDGNKGADSYYDMFLMSQCDHLIIANSTFSWWAGFLKKTQGNVYAPINWKQGVPSEAICDPTWILI